MFNCKCTQPRHRCILAHVLLLSSDLSDSLDHSPNAFALAQGVPRKTVLYLTVCFVCVGLFCVCVSADGCVGVCAEVCVCIGCLCVSCVFGVCAVQVLCVCVFVCLCVECTLNVCGTVCVSMCGCGVDGVCTVAWCVQVKRMIRGIGTCCSRPTLKL